MWTMRTIPVLKSGHHHPKNLDVVSGFQNGTIPYVVAVLKHGTKSMVSARVINEKSIFVGVKILLGSGRFFSYWGC